MRAKKNIQNICCIGAGYVGGPTMAVIADNCPNLTVNVVDINSERIASWNDLDYLKLPIYEPKLDIIVKRCRNKNLFFSTDIKSAISIADMVFISVNTPVKSKGIGAGQASDLKWVEASARQVAEYAKGHTIVVEKSTLPVRTAETIKKILTQASFDRDSESNNKTFSVLSNPEFLAEGTAIEDLQNPDRVLIGGEDPEAIESLFEIYRNWVSPSKIITTSLWSSELSKLVANAFLAQRISSINSISALCERTGADIQEVKKAIATDTRIGRRFLEAGPGFGGSCFQKDILNIVYLSNFYGLKEVADYWNQVVLINNWTRERISQIILEKLFGNLSGKKLAIFGFSFKANTNDTRESSAIKICRNLLEEGAELSIYDPKVDKIQIERELANASATNYDHEKIGKWAYSHCISESAKDSDAIVILTEWEEFKAINWSEINALMRKPSWLFDTRNISNYKYASECGMNVWRLGKGDL